MTSYKSTAHALTTIARIEGLRGLYPGLAPALIGSSISWGAYFLFAEIRLPVARKQGVRWSGSSILTGSTRDSRSRSGSSSFGIVKLKLEEKNVLEPATESIWSLRGGMEKMNLVQHLSRWPLRQCSTKASPSGYRSLIVAKSAPTYSLRGGMEKMNFVQHLSGWPLRQCSTKASPSGYKSSVVAKSTRNMPLTPKKWKRTLPSKEVLNAVYSLRRAKRNPDSVKEVLRKYVSRLLKLEMMLVLAELQRLEEWHLAHQVFGMIRREPWYRPDVYLFQTMVQVFGKNKQLKLAEKMFEDLEDEGLQPDDSIKRELLRSYVICGMMPEAIQLYKEMLKLGKDQAARSILFHGLSPEEKEELALYEREEGIDWSFVEKRG